MRTVSTEEVISFAEQGFLVMDGALSAKEVLLISNAFDGLLAGSAFPEKNEGPSPDSYVYSDYPELDEFLRGPQLSALSQLLLAVESQIFQGYFSVKTPGARREAVWHRDGGYVGAPHKPFITISFMLDASTTDNGCLYFLPEEIKSANKQGLYRELMMRESVKLFDEVEIGVPAVASVGSVIVYSSQVLHRSAANTSSLSSRVYSVRFAPDDVLLTGQNVPPCLDTCLARPTD